MPYLHRIRTNTMAETYPFESLQHEAVNESDMRLRAEEFHQSIAKRRTVRDFSSKAVPQDVIESAIAAAGTAPSGANMQPWHFVAVGNAETKRQIRQAAEKEERELYDHRASDEWLEALAPLGTDANKPFLETAPWLIAVFSQKYTIDESGVKRKHYYTQESVGIATGLLITALHQAGLVTLTHTPSPMEFLRTTLDRPAYERPFLLLVTGYPAIDAKVPSIQKKSLNRIMTVKA